MAITHHVTSCMRLGGYGRSTQSVQYPHNAPGLVRAGDQAAVGSAEEEWERAAAVIMASHFVSRTKHSSGPQQRQHSQTRHAETPPHQQQPRQPHNRQQPTTLLPHCVACHTHSPLSFYSSRRSPRRLCRQHSRIHHVSLHPIAAATHVAAQLLRPTRITHHLLSSQPFASHHTTKHAPQRDETIHQRSQHQLRSSPLHPTPSTLPSTSPPPLLPAPRVRPLHHHPSQRRMRVRLVHRLCITAEHSVDAVRSAEKSDYIAYDRPGGITTQRTYTGCE